MNTLCRSIQLWLVVLAVVCGTAISALGHEITIVAPNRLEDVEGDSVSNASAGTGARGQQIYSASEFRELPETHRKITAMAFRPDGSVTEPQTVTWPETQWYFSTTTRGIDDMSNVFAENEGADKTLVYEGLLTLTTEATGPPGGPRAFDYKFELQTPFVYDPSDEKNLVVELRSPAGYTPALLDDEQPSVPDSTLLVDFPFTGTPAATGFFHANQWILQFTFVPEPSTFTLAAFGLVSLLAWRQKKRPLSRE